jgi:hypothetical protein
MKKIFKTGLGVGITSMLALGLAIPVFSNVDVKSLSVSGVQAVTAFVADEGDVEKVTEASTDVTTEASTDVSIEASTDDITVAAPDATSEAAKEDITVAAPDVTSEAATEEESANVINNGDEKIVKKGNYIEITSKITDEPYLEYYADDIDELLEESKKFDITKYDPELQKIAEDYLAKGLYCSDLEFSALKFGSGVGYCNIDEENKIITDVLFTNGFDVVDENNGNNTFYISVLRMTPEEFAMYERESGMNMNGARTETATEIKYEMNDEFNNWTLTYNKETGIYIESNYFTEAAMNAVG